MSGKLDRLTALLGLCAIGTAGAAIGRSILGDEGTRMSPGSADVLRSLKDDDGWHRLVETGRIVGLANARVRVVVAVDYAFFSTERIPESGYATGFWGAPDLAVEIASPSNRVPEMRAKVAEYLNAGVRLVWVVDPLTRSVSIHQTGARERSPGAGVAERTPGAGVAERKPGAGVAERTLGDDEVLDGGHVLPGFRLPLAAFFAL